MKKTYARIIHWIKTARYFWAYSKESVTENIDRDSRALKLSIRHPISTEDSRKLIDTAESLGISDSTVEKLVDHSVLLGYDRLSFPLDMMLLFRIEFRRKGINFDCKKGR